MYIVALYSIPAKKIYYFCVLLYSVMETIEHTNCGTPDCCQQCTPIQLELFPVSIYAKDTKQKPLSFDGGAPLSLQLQEDLEPISN